MKTSEATDRRLRVAVVGGGISGLASAALLARDGHEVTVLERHDRLGGRARRWTSEGFTFDTGPSWYLMPEVYEHFFALMGTTVAQQYGLDRLDPAYRVVFEPVAGQIPDDLLVRSDRSATIALFEGIEPGAGRRIARYLDSAAATYATATGSFLYNPFRDVRSLLQGPVLRRLPALAGLLATSLHRRSGTAVRDPRLRRVLDYPAVLLGASPFSAPAMYHLMSHLDLVEGVWYPHGGFAAVVDAIESLARAHGVTVRTGTEVTGIDVAGGRARGVRWRPTDPSRSTPRRLDADLVVATADLHHTETALLPPHARDRSARHWRRLDAGPGAVLVMLGVRGRLPQLEHHTLLFADRWRENFEQIFGADPRVPTTPSLYVSRTSASDPTVAPEGHEALFVLVPVPARPDIGAGGTDGSGAEQVERVADLAIEQIASWAGIPDLAERIVLRRTVGPADFARDHSAFRGGALGPAHTLTQSAFLRGRTASRRTAGLVVAGATTVPGIGVPMCLISAELVLKHVRGDRTAGPLPEPAARPGSPTRSGSAAATLGAAAGAVPAGSAPTRPIGPPDPGGER